MDAEPDHIPAKSSKTLRSQFGQNYDVNSARNNELGKAKALIARKGTCILLEASKKQRGLLASLKVSELV